MKLYGCFSARQARLTGTLLYERPDGTTVEVSSVSPDPEFNMTWWDDKVLLGEVTKFVRKLTEPEIP